MSGFKDQQLNEIAKEKIFEDIIDFVFISLEHMKTDLLLQNKKLKNKEEEIRTHLLEHYLNDADFRQKVSYNDLLIFNAEVAEGYDEKSEKYIGRVDIKVYNIDTLKSTGKEYYIIECKRLDGSNILNEKYVTEGICRFVLDNPKYSSHNKKNIMLGFIVKNIDVEKNAQKINDIQNKNESIHIIEAMYKCKMAKEEYYLYKNKYQCKDKQIELAHMFYNLSEINE